MGAHLHIAVVLAKGKEGTKRSFLSVLSTLAGSSLAEIELPKKNGQKQELKPCKSINSKQGFEHDSGQQCQVHHRSRRRTKNRALYFRSGSKSSLPKVDTTHQIIVEVMGGRDKETANGDCCLRNLSVKGKGR